MRMPCILFCVLWTWWWFVHELRLKNHIKAESGKGLWVWLSSSPQSCQDHHEFSLGDQRSPCHLTQTCGKLQMSIISTALRHFREPTKEQLTQIFFSLPALESGDDAEKSGGQDVSKMDINAVLSLGEAEDSYVSLTNAIWASDYNSTLRRRASSI